MNAPIPKAPVQQVLLRAPKAGLAPSLERRRLQVYLAQLVVDCVIILGAFALAGSLLDRKADPMFAANIMLPIFLTIALYNGTYSIASLMDWRTGLQRMLTALLISVALLGFVVFFAKVGSQVSRLTFFTALPLAAFGLGASRKVMVAWLKRFWGPSPKNVLVIDAGGPEVRLMNAYWISAAERGLVPALDDPHALDRISRYLQNMDEVLVSCPLDQRFEWAMVLKGAGVHGEVTSGVAREIGAIGIVNHDDAGVSSLLVSLGPLAMRSRIAKRLFDLFASSLALLVLSPLLLLTALAIKLEDGGPVFFKQMRIGRRNRLFPIYKFRSMKVENSDAAGHISTLREDDRVTRIGKLIRRTSIDELPQLINVINGTMSLVGPRPHAIGSLAGDKLFWEIDRRYWLRHSLRPGLTGLAQVRGFRGATAEESDLSFRLTADLEYLRGWSIWRDIGILFATLKVLVHHRAF